VCYFFQCTFCLNNRKIREKTKKARQTSVNIETAYFFLLMCVVFCELPLRAENKYSKMFKFKYKKNEKLKQNKAKNKWNRRKIYGHRL